MKSTHIQQSNCVESRNVDNSYSRNSHFLLDLLQRIPSVTNLVLYVDKAGYTSNSDISRYP